MYTMQLLPINLGMDLTALYVSAMVRYVLYITKFLNKNSQAYFSTNNKNVLYVYQVS